MILEIANWYICGQIVLIFLAIFICRYISSLWTYFLNYSRLERETIIRYFHPLAFELSTTGSWLPHIKLLKSQQLTAGSVSQRKQPKASGAGLPRLAGLSRILSWTGFFLVIKKITCNCKKITCNWTPKLQETAIITRNQASRKIKNKTHPSVRSIDV